MAAKAAAPVFFVIVVVDINSGVGTRNTLYLEDLKASISGAIPSDEYYLREVSEIFGDKSLVGDRTGKNLARTEVTWPDFLVSQIKQRIRFGKNSRDDYFYGIKFFFGQLLQFFQEFFNFGGIEPFVHKLGGFEN